MRNAPANFPLLGRSNFPLKTGNARALQAFCISLADARELTTLIARHLDEHMEVGPDEVNWAHVGDANRIREALKEIATTFHLI